MTTKEVRIALESHLAATFPTLLVAWPNVDFDPATQAKDANGDAVLWICPTNKPGKSFEGEKDQDGLSLRPGAFIVQVFAPGQNGCADAEDVANAIEAAYHKKDVGKVKCNEAYSNDVGNDGRGWYQFNAVVPWWAWIGE